MLISLFTYIILAALLYFLAKDQLNSQYGKLMFYKSFWTWQNVSAILIFAFFYGVRYNVGVDNMMYISTYEVLLNGSELSEHFELGYTWIANLFASLDAHYSIFIAFWGALQIFFVYYAMRRNVYLLPYIALFIVLGPVFLNWANIMRQAVAECIFIYSIELITDKKLLKYCFWIILASLIHKSAILLFPFYFILQKPIFSKSRGLLVGILLICTVIGWTPAFMHLMDRIEGVLSFLEYDAYVNNLNNIIADSNNFRQWGPARAGTWILYIVTIWIYPKASKSLNLDKRFDIYFECFFYGRCLYELLANTSQIFIRPISYFVDFYIIIVPVCLYYLYKQKKQLLYIAMLVLSYFYTIYWTFKAYTSGGAGDNACEVYKYFFIQ